MMIELLTGVIFVVFVLATIVVPMFVNSGNATLLLVVALGVCVLLACGIAAVIFLFSYKEQSDE